MRIKRISRQTVNFQKNLQFGFICDIIKIVFCVRIKLNMLLTSSEGVKRNEQKLKRNTGDDRA